VSRRRVLKDSNARRNPLLLSSGCCPHVVFGLQIDPKARLHLKEQAKAQGKMGSDQH